MKIKTTLPSTEIVKSFYPFAKNPSVKRQYHKTKELSLST